MPNYPIKISISEAARLFGIDSLTIRRAIKRNELQYIIVQGRYKVDFNSLVNWAHSRSTIQNKMNARGIGQFVDKWKGTAAADKNPQQK